MPPKKTPRSAAAQKKSSKKKEGVKKTTWIYVAAIVIAAVTLFFVFRDKGPEAPTGPAEVAVVTEKTTDVGDATGPVRETLAAMARARLVFESVGNKAIVRVVVEKATGKSGGPVTYRYDWSINGQPAGDGSDRLSGFKGGDRIAVTVTPFEDEVPGQPRTLMFDVRNVPPRIVSETGDAKFDGKTFSYQVKAVGQEGDRLTYSLTGAPQGMTINPETGLINWQLTENDYGEHAIQVSVADSKGAVTTHTVKVDLPKPSEDK